MVANCDISVMLRLPTLVSYEIFGYCMVQSERQIYAAKCVDTCRDININTELEK